MTVVQCFFTAVSTRAALVNSVRQHIYLCTFWCTYKYQVLLDSCNLLMKYEQLRIMDCLQPCNGLQNMDVLD